MKNGLTSEEVVELQKVYGKNELVEEKKESLFVKIFHIICEPMFLLLIVAATLYFILGEPRDGMIMLVFVIGIILIEVVQEWKTDRTLQALKNLSEPKIEVLRDGEKKIVNSSDLVPGDVIYVYEGIKIPADGYVIKCSGLKVDESSLTGESVGVFKTTTPYTGKDYWRDDYCYQGTLVIQGTGMIKVDKIGRETEYGKIGINVNNANFSKTLLQKQMDSLVKWCALIALILFLLVSIFTFLDLKDINIKQRLIDSVLSGITLAMAMIPEEFPVVFTVFLSMGAWRLAKKNSLAKKLPAVETLGAVSVLCVDKTGTITKNQMEIVDTYADDINDMVLKMCLCCEDDTYDPMEKAMFKYARKFKISKNMITSYNEVKTYPFSNDTKIMGIAHNYNDSVLLTVKGSYESVLPLCKLDEKELRLIEDKVMDMQKHGLRVIAIASKSVKDSQKLKNDINDMVLKFDGLVGLIDPPRDNIKEDIAVCQEAGIRVIMITGDNGITAASIAKSIGIKNTDNIITGEMLDKMSFNQLKEAVKNVSIFSRVIPEHKMQIVKAFQANNEVVAMTGDGVNDAPALKQADIGIAMGMRGSEVSREAADIVLLDDNFKTIVDTIEDGRRIYNNIKKAFSYIFVIHIPIAIISLLCPLLKISSSDLFLLPLHVVLLELIIDPTCSIVLERQPIEKNAMKVGPRNVNDKIAGFNLIARSIFQGIIIACSSFGVYYYILKNLGNASVARTMGLLIIVLSNTFLVQVNSSEYDSVFKSIKNLIKDRLVNFINMMIIIISLILIYSPLNNFFKLTSLSLKEFIVAVFIAFISVYWYEFIKMIKRKKSN